MHNGAMCTMMPCATREDSFKNVLKAELCVKVVAWSRSYCIARYRCYYEGRLISAAMTNASSKSSMAHKRQQLLNSATRKSVEVYEGIVSG